MKRFNKIFTIVLITSVVCQQKSFCQNQFSGLLSATSTFSKIKFEEAPVKRNSDYKNAIGIRAGGTSGITFKHFFNNYNAFEGILALWPDAIGITALYEKHTPTGLSGFRFYYGGGGHFNTETNHYYYQGRRDYYSDRYDFSYGRRGFGLGIDGIVGLDYKIPVIPFSISFDLKPLVEVNNYGNIFTAIDPGLGIKVTF